MKLSCSLTSSLEAPRYARIAEDLGYERAWLYDSPAIYTDVWMAMAIAAEQTSRIGIGPAVLVPSLRHPMTTASAISTLCALAPGRVAVAVGTGFSGRYALGQKPMRWVDVENYVATVKGLLLGDTMEWEGAPIRMLHTKGYGALRPTDIEIIIGAEGPKGMAVADRLADGIITTIPKENAPSGRAHLAIQFGTVIGDDETAHSPRVIDAAGHAVAVLLHAAYEREGPKGPAAFPGGEAWVREIESFEPRTRHLTTHEGHLMRLAPFEREAVKAAADLIPQISFSGTPDELREKAAALEAAGITEIVYQPAGADIEGELRRMAEVLVP